MGSVRFWRYRDERCERTTRVVLVAPKNPFSEQEKGLDSCGALPE